MKKSTYLAVMLLTLATSVFAQLSGTYTVGAGQDYETLTAAVSDLNTNGVSGAVVFELTDAGYISETFPITINEITGASSTNTVTIRPASGVTTEISGDSGGDNTSIIKLYGADYIIIDGSNNGSTSRDLTIENTKVGAWSSTIWLASLGDDQGCHDNVIKNCTLSYGAPSYTAAVINFSGSSHMWTDYGYDNNNNVIENNEIKKCHTGIRLCAISAEKNSGNIIRNNLIGSGNSGDYIDDEGIYCLYQTDLEITGNEIFNIIDNGHVTGIYITICSSVTVAKNKIHDIYSTYEDYQVRGIYFNSNETDPDLTISNNMIWHIASPGNWDEDERYMPTGIYLYSSATTTGIRLYFNSIYLTEDVDNGLNVYDNFSSAMFIDGPTGIDCRNNIFRNSLGEKTGCTFSTTCYGIYVNRSSNPFSVCDHNIYYVNSNSDNNYICYGNSTNYSTLSAWQLFTGDDDNSLNSEPDFTSATNLDLTESNDAGIAISGYSTDINGDERGNPPDIGADEEASVVRLQAKVFLEGAYYADGDTMSTAVNDSIPLTSPYTEDARTIDSVPEDITDWMLVQLRLTAEDTNAVASKSVFLRNDGRIVGDDGTTEYTKIEADSGNYFIVVKHRNHLAVMSDEVHTLGASSSTLYDFTVSDSDTCDRYFGNDAKVLETGVYGMYTGDINQDGEITTSDYTRWYNQARIGACGYNTCDINLDKDVTTTDYTKWYNNACIGASSHVPK